VKARWLRFSIPLAVVPVLLLLAYGFWTNPREIPSPLIGKPAAKFTLTSFTGASLSLEQYRGRVVMLNFWASWCRPACYEEAPVVERAWQAYRDKGVVVLGIDVQDTDEGAQKFIAQFQQTFPNAPDPGGRVAVDYGVYGVPETFFVDRQGRVRFKQVGELTDAVARERLETLLAEKP
jgi:cytochrome c biogenesis protein CcmG, thiol:disulfide interchange protein DsbE